MCTGRVVTRWLSTKRHYWALGACIGTDTSTIHDSDGAKATAQAMLLKKISGE